MAIDFTLTKEALTPRSPSDNRQDTLTPPRGGRPRPHQGGDGAAVSDRINLGPHLPV